MVSKRNQETTESWELEPLAPRHTTKTVERLQFRPKKETKSNTTKRNLFIIVYTFCLMGCIYQIFEASVQYFSYSTVSEISIQPFEYFNAPAISICFPYISLIELSLLFDKFPHLKPVADQIRNETNFPPSLDGYRLKLFKVKPFDFQFGKAIEDSLTLSEIISVTTKFEDIFIRCTYIHPLTYRVIEGRNLTQCLEVFELENFVRDDNKCFKLTYRNLTQTPFVYEMNRLQNSLQYQDFYQQVRLNTTSMGPNVEKGYLYLHPPNRLPRGRVDPIVTIQDVGQLPVTQRLSFRKVKNKLLEEPYATKCKDYSVDGFESRYDCVDQCTQKKSYPIYGKVPITMVFPNDSEYKIMGFKDFKDNTSLWNAVSKIREDCLDQCPSPDCDNEYYFPETISIEPSSVLIFTLVAPTSLETIVELDPDLDLLQYILYHFNTYGFWFGFCFLQLADVLMYIGKKARNVKNT